MPSIASREDFITRSLNRISRNRASVNVTDAQIDDCVDKALDYYKKYHDDGTEIVHIPHQITQDNIDTQQIQLSEGIYDVLQILQFKGRGYDKLLYSYKYNMGTDYSFQSIDQQNLHSFFISGQTRSLVSYMFNPSTGFEFTRASRILRPTLNLGKDLKLDQYICLKVLMEIDPDVHRAIWNDQLLADLCSGYIMQLWGINLTKWDGQTLQTGTTIKAEEFKSLGKEMIEEAKEEIKEGFTGAMGIFVI